MPTSVSNWTATLIHHAESTCAIPQLVAHRGYLTRYPENTWLALEQALRAGACWLEFDVQMCRDGSFVLLHDADLNRTADVDRSVFELNSSELRKLSVHEPRRFGDRFAPLPPTFLEDVLHRLIEFPAARAMVEIKRESLQHWGLEKVMQRLLEILQPRHPQCVLISNSGEALHYARKRTMLEIGWVLERYDTGHLEQARHLEPQYLICNQRKIPAQAIPWRGDWQWMLYDILEPSAALNWAQRYVALIETGDIKTLLGHPLLATHACRHAF